MGRGGAEDQERAALNKPNGAMDIRTPLEQVQRKWQMASATHFLETFRTHLPLREVSEDTAEDLTPDLLEKAIANADVDVRACLMLRDVLISLLVSIGEVSRKNMMDSWFESLRVFVGGRRAEFMDCFASGKNALEGFDKGMDCLAAVDWTVRLGLLLGLCDIAAEESKAVRDAIKECGGEGKNTNSELDVKGYRLAPIGRCSKKRVHFKVGKTRIYSGHKRKGNGALLVECSDAETMGKLADALGGSGQVRDHVLAMKIRDVYLAPLLELEERRQRKVERKRLAEIQREESRRRNATRPRRSTAAYF